MKYTFKLSRTIEFSDIVEACQIVDDDTADAPWDNDTYLEHSTRRADRSDENKPGYAIPQYGRAILIELDDTSSTFDYWRQNGASKQVATEKQSADNAARLAQLVLWYENGWQYYGVTCEFKGAHASCFGFDSYEFAKESRNDIADDIASQLENRRYRIVGKPQNNVRHSRGFYLLQST